MDDSSASLASSLTAGSPSSPSAEMASKEDRRLEDMWDTDRMTNIFKTMECLSSSSEESEESPLLERGGSPLSSSERNLVKSEEHKAKDFQLIHVPNRGKYVRE